MGVTETLERYGFRLKILNQRHKKRKSHVKPVHTTVGKIILKWILNA